VDFSIVATGETECLTCFEPVYLTDHIGASMLKGSFFQPMMLLMERMLMNGLIKGAITGESKIRPESTLFVMDGPLALYDNYYSFSNYLLEELQGYSSMPALMGIEKTGKTNDFARWESTQAKLLPGQVGMVTTEVAQLLEGKDKDEDYYHPYFYGKKFLYRTKDGDKTFVFMAVPLSGHPYRLSREDEFSEEWSNYPHLRLFCDYIENTYTNRFGLETAALDIISEANFAASLPSILSMRFLNQLIEENTGF